MAAMASATDPYGAAGTSFNWDGFSSSNTQSSSRRKTGAMSIVLGAFLGLLGFSLVLGQLVAKNSMAESLISFDLACVRDHLGAANGDFDLVADCQATSHHDLGRAMVPALVGKLVAKPMPRLSPPNSGTLRAETYRASPVSMSDMLVSRRSITKFDVAKPVPQEVTDRALNAAILAPNHFLSEPWRFYSCGPETKEKLRNLNEAKKKAADGVPEMLVVTVASEHDLSEKLGLEDHAAVAAATQNFMLSLTADGVGSKWMTGALGAPPEDVLAAVGAPDGEKLMGVIWYGYPQKPLADAKTPPRKKGLDGVLKRLP